LRVPKYNLDDRFDRIDDYKIRISINQYNKPSFEDDMDNTYAWLISNTQIQPSEGGGHFKCWIVDTTAIGIQVLPTTGYARFSFRGVYCMAHVFTWLYHHPGQKLNNDASHICGKNLCVRHIVDEPREYNNSRSGCIGYLIDPMNNNNNNNNNNNIVKLCTHDPPCKTVKLYNLYNTVILPFEN